MLYLCAVTKQAFAKDKSDSRKAWLTNWLSRRREKREQGGNEASDALCEGRSVLRGMGGSLFFNSGIFH